MRLIDADALLEELSSFSVQITGRADAMARMVMEETKQSIVKIVSEQPTAYDVDKVVERLMCESVNCHLMIYRAIEIVKAGGVNE